MSASPNVNRETSVPTKNPPRPGHTDPAIVRNFCIIHSAFSASAEVPMMRPQYCGWPLSRYRRAIAVSSLT